MLIHPDNKFIGLPEPEQSCLLYLRQFISEFKPGISEHWHFNTPFYYYKERWMCYISYEKKHRTIYLAFVHGYKLKHKKLLSEGRKKMKVFYLDAAKDVDVQSLKQIFTEVTKYIDGLPKKKKDPESKLTRTPLK